MATRNKRKPAALNKENCREHPKSNWAQNLNVPRSQEDYITQVSEEIEGRVIKKLSQEFSRTENHILGALARLDHFLTNPLIQGQSGPAPETSRNIFSISQGTNEDDSQSNPHIEAGVFNNPMTQNSGPEDGHDTRFHFLPVDTHLYVFWNGSELAGFMTEPWFVVQNVIDNTHTLFVWSIV